MAFVLLFVSKLHDKNECCNANIIIKCPNAHNIHRHPIQFIWLNNITSINISIFIFYLIAPLKYILCFFAWWTEIGLFLYTLLLSFFFLIINNSIYKTVDISLDIYSVCFEILWYKYYYTFMCVSVRYFLFKCPIENLNDIEDVWEWK